MYSQEEVTSAIKNSWSAMTTKSRRWSPENPAFGQSDVSSLAFHDFVGGNIVRQLVLLPNGENAYHYSNVLGDEQVDLTREQYLGPDGLLKADIEFVGEVEPVDRAMFGEHHPISGRLDALKHYMTSLYLSDETPSRRS